MRRVAFTYPELAHLALRNVPPNCNSHLTLNMISSSNLYCTWILFGVIHWQDTSYSVPTIIVCVSVSVPVSFDLALTPGAGFLFLVGGGRTLGGR